MTFRVVWKPEAEQELTQLWLANRIRSELTNAAASIDEYLQRDPAGFGDSRDESLRIAFVPPLGVLFDVDQAARLVVVIHVWRM